MDLFLKFLILGGKYLSQLTAQSIVEAYRRSIQLGRTLNVTAHQHAVAVVTQHENMLELYQRNLDDFQVLPHAHLAFISEQHRQEFETYMHDIELAPEDELSALLRHQLPQQQQQQHGTLPDDGDVEPAGYVHQMAQNLLSVMRSPVSTPRHSMGEKPTPDELNPDAELSSVLTTTFAMHESAKGFNCLTPRVSHAMHLIRETEQDRKLNSVAEYLDRQADYIKGANDTFKQLQVDIATKYAQMQERQPDQQKSEEVERDKIFAQKLRAVQQEVKNCTKLMKQAQDHFDVQQDDHQTKRLFGSIDKIINDVEAITHLMKINEDYFNECEKVKYLQTKGTADMEHAQVMDANYSAYNKFLCNMVGQQLKHYTNHSLRVYSTVAPTHITPIDANILGFLNRCKDTESAKIMEVNQKAFENAEKQLKYPLIGRKNNPLKRSRKAATLSRNKASEKKDKGRKVRHIKSPARKRWYKFSKSINRFNICGLSQPLNRKSMNELIPSQGIALSTTWPRKKDDELFAICDPQLGAPESSEGRPQININSAIKNFLQRKSFPQPAEPAADGSNLVVDDNLDYLVEQLLATMKDEHSAAVGEPKVDWNSTDYTDGLKMKTLSAVKEEISKNLQEVRENRLTDDHKPVFVKLAEIKDYPTVPDQQQMSITEFDLPAFPDQVTFDGEQVELPSASCNTYINVSSSETFPVNRVRFDNVQTQMPAPNEEPPERVEVAAVRVPSINYDADVIPWETKKEMVPAKADTATKNEENVKAKALPEEEHVANRPQWFKSQMAVVQLENNQSTEMLEAEKHLGRNAAFQLESLHSGTYSRTDLTMMKNSQPPPASPPTSNTPVLTNMEIRNAVKSVPPPLRRASSEPDVAIVYDGKDYETIEIGIISADFASDQADISLHIAVDPPQGPPAVQHSDPPSVPMVDQNVGSTTASLKSPSTPNIDINTKALMDDIVHELEEKNTLLEWQHNNSLLQLACEMNEAAAIKRKILKEESRASIQLKKFFKREKAAIGPNTELPNTSQDFKPCPVTADTKSDKLKRYRYDKQFVLGGNSNKWNHLHTKTRTSSKAHTVVKTKNSEITSLDMANWASGILDNSRGMTGTRRISFNKSADLIVKRLRPSAACTTLRKHASEIKLIPMNLLLPKKHGYKKQLRNEADVSEDSPQKPKDSFGAKESLNSTGNKYRVESAKSFAKPTQTKMVDSESVDSVSLRGAAAAPRRGRVTTTECKGSQFPPKVKRPGQWDEESERSQSIHSLQHQKLALSSRKTPIGKEANFTKLPKQNQFSMNKSTDRSVFDEKYISIKTLETMHNLRKIMAKNVKSGGIPGGMNANPSLKSEYSRLNQKTVQSMMAHDSKDKNSHNDSIDGANDGIKAVTKRLDKVVGSAHAKKPEDAKTNQTKPVESSWVLPLSDAPIIELKRFQSPEGFKCAPSASKLLEDAKSRRPEKLKDLDIKDPSKSANRSVGSCTIRSKSSESIRTTDSVVSDFPRGITKVRETRPVRITPTYVIEEEVSVKSIKSEGSDRSVRGDDDEPEKFLVHIKIPDTVPSSKNECDYNIQYKYDTPALRHSHSKSGEISPIIKETMGAYHSCNNESTIKKHTLANKILIDYDAHSAQVKEHASGSCPDSGSAKDIDISINFVEEDLDKTERVDDGRKMTRVRPFQTRHSSCSRMKPLVNDLPRLDKIIENIADEAENRAIVANQSTDQAGEGSLIDITDLMSSVNVVEPLEVQKAKPATCEVPQNESHSEMKKVYDTSTTQPVATYPDVVNYMAAPALQSLEVTPKVDTTPPRAEPLSSYIDERITCDTFEDSMSVAKGQIKTLQAIHNERRKPLEAADTNANVNASQLCQSKSEHTEQYLQSTHSPRRHLPESKQSELPKTKQNVNAPDQNVATPTIAVKNPQMTSSRKGPTKVSHPIPQPWKKPASAKTKASKSNSSLKDGMQGMQRYAKLDSDRLTVKKLNMLSKLHQRPKRTEVHHQSTKLNITYPPPHTPKISPAISVALNPVSERFVKLKDVANKLDVQSSVRPEVVTGERDVEQIPMRPSSAMHDFQPAPERPAPVLQMAQQTSERPTCSKRDNSPRATASKQEIPQVMQQPPVKLASAKQEVAQAPVRAKPIKHDFEQGHIMDVPIMKPEIPHAAPRHVHVKEEGQQNPIKPVPMSQKGHQAPIKFASMPKIATHPNGVTQKQSTEQTMIKRSPSSPQTNTTSPPRSKTIVPKVVMPPSPKSIDAHGKHEPAVKADSRPVHEKPKAAVSTHAPAIPTANVANVTLSKPFDMHAVANEMILSDANLQYMNQLSSEIRNPAYTRMLKVCHLEQEQQSDDVKTAKSIANVQALIQPLPEAESQAQISQKSLPAKPTVSAKSPRAGQSVHSPRSNQTAPAANQSTKQSDTPPLLPAQQSSTNETFFVNQFRGKPAIPKTASKQSFQGSKETFITVDGLSQRPQPVIKTYSRRVLDNVSKRSRDAILKEPNSNSQGKQAISAMTEPKQVHATKRRDSGSTDDSMPDHLRLKGSERERNLRRLIVLDEKIKKLEAKRAKQMEKDATPFDKTLVSVLEEMRCKKSSKFPEPASRPFATKTMSGFKENPTITSQYGKRYSNSHAQKDVRSVTAEEKTVQEAGREMPAGKRYATQSYRESVSKVVGTEEKISSPTGEATLAFAACAKAAPVTNAKRKSDISIEDLSLAFAEPAEEFIKLPKGHIRELKERLRKAAPAWMSSSNPTERQAEPAAKLTEETGRKPMPKLPLARRKNLLPNIPELKNIEVVVPRKPLIMDPVPKSPSQPKTPEQTLISPPPFRGHVKSTYPVDLHQDEDRILFRVADVDDAKNADESANLPPVVELLGDPPEQKLPTPVYMPYALRPHRPIDLTQPPQMKSQFDERKSKHLKRIQSTVKVAMKEMEHKEKEKEEKRNAWPKRSINTYTNNFGRHLLRLMVESESNKRPRSAQEYERNLAEKLKTMSSLPRIKEVEKAEPTNFVYRAPVDKGGIRDAKKPSISEMKRMILKHLKDAPEYNRWTGVRSTN